ncbi:CaiB/BaiF CoA transferase family protein [Verminephrobacter eiseniae]|uniref:CaiB/BaiF CoA transferase family protein n=1 Tax=Verminephrobacter eiseniae TaxID=364317 RepID=UPI002238E8A1|nr:CaiB/BaiF CoA-transferase family protein [Verminephrobacter eiseniae]MCW5236967.1 CoA transferase [Verminephrobacter eiseniae]
MSTPAGHLPLAGLLVLDFSQFLAGPSATLRMADMGATVIKVERPVTGDLCRQLYISDLEIDGDSTLFHTINRNKRSYAADLKNPDDLAKVRRLIGKADLMIENFRPGVMERIGLSYEEVRALNPRIIYGSVTGYGRTGPWIDLPGQDLLAQSRSGVVWLNGDADQGPVPVGLALADILTGAHLVQGLLGALVRRGIHGQGARVEVSLLESVLDFQFEVLTTYLNDGARPPKRSAVNNAHAYLGAPYGIYATADGYLSLAMGPIETLSKALDCTALQPYLDRNCWFTRRDAIKDILGKHLKTQATQYWLDRLIPVDYWCAPVMTWAELLEHDGFKTLDFLQDVVRGNGARVRTTRCPIRFDGIRPQAARAAPKVAEDNAWVEANYLAD